MKEIAILGPTASGKSALAVKIAKEVGANILSLDSLSIYKEIDIVSAKPTIDQMSGVKHFGIDEFYINEHFSVSIFFELYKRAKEISIKESKNLIIVGGTSFYLKSMIDGLSDKILPSSKTKESIKERLLDLESAFFELKSLDPEYAKKISSSDRYRVEKWYEIYLESGEVATEYFLKNRKKGVLKDIPIFEISIDKDILRERIRSRTIQMIDDGAIDEVFYLEKRYSRLPIPMGAIGVREILEFLDGKIDKNRLIELISIHTFQLAKRQEKFNRSKFPNRITMQKELLYEKIKSIFD